MFNAKFLRNVLVKAVLLLAVVNLLFAVLQPLPALGRISGYNTLFPGRLRFPFGENQTQAYNLSLYNVEAMFASLALNGSAKAADEFRVLVIGDSSMWGTLLRPQDTLAGQLNAAGLTACDGRKIRVYNLGYPTLSVTKDLMVLDEAMRYQPDLIVWGVTLEALPNELQLVSPILANNPQRAVALIQRFNLAQKVDDPALIRPDFWQQTLFGQRRAVADLIRLQLYGVMWGSTGIDQTYPQNYTPAARDLDADQSFHKRQPPQLEASSLAFDVLQAGIQRAGKVPVLLVNEPMLVSSSKNSEVRYNFFYPRWAYDQYRQLLSERAKQGGWHTLDAWDLVAESEFTNSAIHLTPAGEKLFAQQVGKSLTGCTGN